MKSRIDPLIAERAPWLHNGRHGGAVARQILDGLLGYRRTLKIAEALEPLPASRIMDRMAGMLARDVQVSGLEHLPRSGPALIVANHPTGIADGIILWSVLAPLRPDLFIYANSDILRVLPQMAEIIVPVEWRLDKRTHAKTRETMTLTRAALAEGRMGVIFPSGRLAKRHGLRLHERAWMPSAAMIARKMDVPVIPINIRARNSALFYLFDLIHPTLRDITLFHETLNKDRQPFRLTIGRPIAPANLPAASSDAIGQLQEITLGLPGAGQRAVGLIDATRRPALGRRRSSAPV